MEENEKVTDQIAEATDAGAEATEREESGERASELRLFGRAIAEELRGIIDAELDRRFAAMAESDAEAACDDALAEIARDPRFLRILSEKLALEAGGGSSGLASARRRGASVLPATARQTPKTLDDAKSAARKYFRID